MTNLGEILKKHRKNLGKSLRDVEKKTGVSSAHLSQIESGKIKKPSGAILEKLAGHYGKNANELEREAEAENKKTTKVGYLPLSIISASDLNEFADKKEADGMLPKIVRDLIASTVDYKSLSMPKESSIYLPGWDGQLICKTGFEPFVPEGISCWEMSKEKNTIAKANSDIQKREGNPLGANKKQCSYIFATLRRISNKNSWIQKQKNRKVWKDVRFIDAEVLENWLERSPVVAMKLARTLGIVPSDATTSKLCQSTVTLQLFWDMWIKSTNPKINEDILLKFGEDIRENITEFLSNPFSKYYELNVSDIDSGIAYIYAAISNMKSEIKHSLLSRSIVIETSHAFQELSYRNTSLLLISQTSDTPVGYATENNHRVIYLNDDKKDSFKRVPPSYLFSYLKNNGMETEDARNHVSMAHGNLSILRKTLSRSGEISNPTWSNAKYGFQIAPLALFGSWSLAREYDRDFISEVVGEKPNILKKKLLEFSLFKTPPLKIIGDKCIFYQEFALIQLYKYLDIEYIEKFIDYSSKLILCEYNDKYDLIKEERFFSSLYDKGLSSSFQLRHGIATSFAILANHTELKNERLKNILNDAVKNILGERSDWKYWASLEDILTLLVEVEPYVFLNELNKICENSDFIKILSESNSMGECPYAPILWSLEICAWEKEYIKDATKILFKISKYQDNNSNYENQPKNTLINIYRIWNPQTSCSFSERLDILKSLYPEYIDDIWNLLIEIIPKYNDFSLPTYRAKYRSLPLQKNEGKTYKDLHQFSNKIIDWIELILQEHPDKWIDAFSILFDNLKKSVIIKILNILKNVDIDTISDEVRVELWKVIEHTYAKHQDFYDAHWSFKGELLEKLGDIYKKFIPNNSIERWGHIFSCGIHHPSIRSSVKDHAKRKKELEELQVKAIKEIIAQHQDDNNAIFELLKDNPTLNIDIGILAKAYANSFSKENDKLKFIYKFDYLKNDKNSSFYDEFVYWSCYKKDTDWINKNIVKKDIKLERRAKIYLAMPFQKITWDIVENSEENIKNCYWKKVDHYHIDNTSENIWLCRKFIEYNRPLITFDILGILETNNEINNIPDATKFILDTLKKIQYCDPASKDYNRIFQFDFTFTLKRLLKFLKNSNQVNRKDIALIEWSFNPGKGYEETPIMAEEVADNAKLFVELLKRGYREDNRKDREIGEENDERATSFLFNYKTVPGVNRNNSSFDEEHFSIWVQKALEMCEQCNRLIVGSYILGKTLAHSPIDDKDGQWPHRSVRDVIEKYDSDPMKRGFQTGTINKRGIVQKSTYEGGKQEYNLAQEYFTWSKNIAYCWPKTSEILKNVGNWYSNRGKEEDERSELGMHRDD